jgi:hypothetical protein
MEMVSLLIIEDIYNVHKARHCAERRESRRECSGLSRFLAKLKRLPSQQQSVFIPPRARMRGRARLVLITELRFDWNRMLLHYAVGIRARKKRCGSYTIKAKGRFELGAVTTMRSRNVMKERMRSRVYTLRGPSTISRRADVRKTLPVALTRRTPTCSGAWYWLAWSGLRTLVLYSITAKSKMPLWHGTG